MEEHLSVDEQIIAYKGKKSALRQYNPKKPKKWGWKIFVLSGRSGLIHGIEFYGQDVDVPPEGLQVNKPGQVVLRLASKFPNDRNFKLYFDNWFNSPNVQVALALRDIWSIGTLILNRAKGLKFEFDRSPPRGTHLTKCMKIQGVDLFATQWLDNKPVTLLSTFVASTPEIAVSRFDRQSKDFNSVPAPQCIAVYNKHMGYVDEINSYLGRFRVTTHCRSRAYIKIFLNFVNIIATNCWLQYRRDAENVLEKKNILSLYDFKASLAESLCREGTTSGHTKRASLEIHMSRTSRPGPRAKLPSADIRLDNLGHWPISIGSGNRGAICKMTGCSAKPVTKCEKCDVHLCIVSKNCFKVFHITPVL